MMSGHTFYSTVQNAQPRPERVMDHGTLADGDIKKSHQYTTPFDVTVSNMVAGQGEVAIISY